MKGVSTGKTVEEMAETGLDMSDVHSCLNMCAPVKAGEHIHHAIYMDGHRCTQDRVNSNEKGYPLDRLDSAFMANEATNSLPYNGCMSSESVGEVEPPFSTEEQRYQNSQSSPLGAMIVRCLYPRVGCA